ncbi:hypothetical protein DMA12_13665 [Amycolatopsis balhimycina DSM 5908]|uniref:Uncharacterized protein n=1 Tax=Amycolatopsis balhimycina DSM 5908 TaxID=1081091 RepID=A0A428WQZ1_AMYBA|nr:hypothetical protein [Amycolatopsis balhimycina]RSM45505.1 hypothetical protein DMA12_13665 [Amycolatopsis balhimycina DSM 5908]
MAGENIMDFMRPQVDEILDLAVKAGPDTFSDEAQRVLSSDDNGDKAIFSAAARQPFIVASDAASAARLPNLVPESWRPHFTELLLRAVEDD